MDREGFRLVQKRQLFFAPNDLCGRLSDQASKRPSKVCLIEIASKMYGVENGDALPQQVRCIACSFDLTKSSAGDACSPQEMPLRGSHRQRPDAPLQSGSDGRITQKETSLHKPLDECLCIIEIRILPRRTVQPERTTRRTGQCHIFLITETSWQESWHERAQFEANAEPLTFGGAVDGRCRVRKTLPLCRVTAISK